MKKIYKALDGTPFYNIIDCRNYDLSNIPKTESVNIYKMVRFDIIRSLLIGEVVLCEN